jgi:small subunit ribosomal protein S17
MAKATVTKAKAAQAPSDETAERGRRIEAVGEVVSDKMNKTISVLIYRLVRHKKYGKFMRRTSVFKAHDEKNVAKVGDTVRIFQTRPLSKTKRWALAEVVTKSKSVGEEV